MVDAKVTLTVHGHVLTVEGSEELVRKVMADCQSSGGLLATVLTERTADDPADAEDLTEAGLKLAWDWFALHAGQRMQSINFFLIAAAFLCAAYVTALRENVPGVAAGVGVVGALTALFFYRLERRVRLLVRAGEEAMRPFQERIADRTGNEAMRISDRVESPGPGIWPYSLVFARLHQSTGWGFAIGVLYAIWKASSGSLASPAGAEYFVSVVLIGGAVLLWMSYSALGEDRRPSAESGVERAKAHVVWGLWVVTAAAGIGAIGASAWLCVLAVRG